MLEAFGKWWDSLWEPNPNFMCTNNPSALAEKVPTEPVVRKRHFGPTEVAEGIRYYGQGNSDNVIKVTRTYIGREYKHVNGDYKAVEVEQVEYGYYVESTNDGVIRLTGLRGKLADVERKFVSDGDIKDYYKKGDLLSWEVLNHGTTIPKIGFKSLGKLKSKPSTAPHFIDGHYYTEIKDGTARFNKEGGATAIVREITLDLFLMLRDDKSIYNDVDYPKWIITDYDKVDRKLIPQNDSRRWVTIKELENAESDWVIRYVPGDSARGAIRYFSMEFNFDAIDLGGVTFDIPKMITCSLRNHVAAWDKELKFQVERRDYYNPPDSFIFINIDNLRVKHNQLDLNVTSYVKHQADNIEFHDVNPYLNPHASSDEFAGNTFGFDDDDYFFHYHQNDCTGDTPPYGRNLNKTAKEN